MEVGRQVDIEGRREYVDVSTHIHINTNDTDSSKYDAYNEHVNEILQ